MAKQSESLSLSFNPFHWKGIKIVGDALTSVQRDEQLAANSNAACKFLEDMETSMINHELMQLALASTMSITIIKGLCR